MLLTTTQNAPGHEVMEFIGLATGDAAVGANVVRDWWAGLADFFGGRSRSYETVLREGKTAALRMLADDARKRGANAVLGITIAVAPTGRGTVWLVSALGTAVVVD